MRADQFKLLTLACITVLFVGCSSTPTEQTAISSRIETTTALIHNSSDTTIISNGYGIRVPANAVSDSTNITVYEDTLLNALASGDFDTLSIGLGVRIEGAILDTIYFTFPELRISNPYSHVVMFSSIDSSFKLLPTVSDSFQVTAAYFPSGIRSLNRRGGPTITMSIVNVKGSSKLRQPRKLFTVRNGELQEFTEDWSVSNEKIAVLVHGIMSHPSRFLDNGGERQSLVEFAKNKYNGRVLLYQYPSGEKVSENASWLYQELNAQVFSRNSNIQIDLYGHSMGGVLARKTVIDHADHFESLVTFGAPHGGADVAGAVEFAIQDVFTSLGAELFFLVMNPFTDGARELRPESALMMSMNTSTMPVSTRYLTVYGNLSRALFGDESDGFILARSANMNHESFPPSHEIPSVLNSYELNQSHTELVFDRDGLFKRVTEFVSNQTGTPPVTDIDGNVYKTVEIGSQLWMAENLKTRHFRNGEAITFAETFNDWSNAVSAVTGDPGFDETNTQVYGLLYNGHAVLDGRLIAPKGWRVATDEDWKILEMHLGMNETEVDATGWRGSTLGGALKEVGLGHWQSGNQGATNSTGFTGLPAGYTKSTYVEHGVSAHFWTSSPSHAYRALRFDRDEIWKNVNPVITHAYSIRCVRE